MIVLASYKPGWNYKRIDKPTMSATRHRLTWETHSIKTAIEPEFGSERTINEFVILGVN